LGTPFFQVFFIFPREISSFSLGKLKIPWENGGAKLALNDDEIIKIELQNKGKNIRTPSIIIG
jgi:hypothetical protein